MVNIKTIILFKKKKNVCYTCLITVNITTIFSAKQIVLYMSDYSKYKNHFLSKTNCAYTCLTMVNIKTILNYNVSIIARQIMNLLFRSITIYSKYVMLKLMSVQYQEFICTINLDISQISTSIILTIAYL